MNNFNIKKGWAVARLNLKSFELLFAVAFAAFVLISLPGIILTAVGGHVEGLGFGSLVFVFAVIVPILLSEANFQKTLRLGTKKKDYFIGVLMLLAVLAAAISLASIVLYYCVDKPLSENLSQMYSLYSVLGFMANGVVVGFLQQAGFIFFLSVAIFLISSIQDTWKGWCADMLVVLLLTLAMRIDVLRTGIMGNLLYLTVTGHPAVQICFTLFGGAALYLLYLLILKRKKI